MKSGIKNITIQATPEKVFAQMGDVSKTGMHMSENSMESKNNNPSNNLVNL